MINSVINSSKQQLQSNKQKVGGTRQKQAQPAKKSAGSGGLSNKQVREITELYYSSMAFYRTGQLIKAREGFVKIIKSGLIPESMANTIRGYIADIDNSLAGNK
jgi:TolA-binding protein